VKPYVREPEAGQAAGRTRNSRETAVRQAIDPRGSLRCWRPRARRLPFRMRARWSAPSVSTEARQRYAARAVLEGFAGRECARGTIQSSCAPTADAMAPVKAAAAAPISRRRRGQDGFLCRADPADCRKRLHRADAQAACTTPSRCCGFTSSRSRSASTRACARWTRSGRHPEWPIRISAEAAMLSITVRPPAKRR